jgi:hypothetical protein
MASANFVYAISTDYGNSMGLLPTVCNPPSTLAIVPAYSGVLGAMHAQFLLRRSDCGLANDSAAEEPLSLGSQST